MSKPMDQQAQALISMMKHHLTCDYKSAENRQRNFDSHLKEFRHFASLPVTHFSPSVWDELTELFEE